MAGDGLHAYLVPPNVRVGDVVTHLGPTTPLGAAWHAPSDPTRPSAAREHDQEHDMTSPTQRRHDEILGRLDALIYAMTPGDKQPAPEPVDVTEEPPVGTQVTDSSGDLWRLRGDGRWEMWLRIESGRWVGDARWSIVREFAPLRLTTDADRERVGLPVDTAPDVDPDEALARVACSAFWGGQVMPSPDSESWLAVARAVREHIEAEREGGGYNIRRAERERERRVKAEEDVERLTRERDEAREVAKSHVEDARDWRRRYEALRADVGTDMDACPNDHTRHHAREILDRDDEWGRDA